MGRFNIQTIRGIKRWLICFVIAIVVVGVITAIVFPVLRYAVKPRVKATVVDTRLNRFALADTRSGRATTTTSFLVYNVSVAIRIHNPSGTTIKLTKPLRAAFAFHDYRLFTVFVAGEGHKYRVSKKEVHPVHAIGEVSSDMLGAAGIQDFKKQNKTGAFKIDVRLSGEIAYLGLDYIGNKREAGFSCQTPLQLAPPGPEVAVFHEVNCRTEIENILF